jgi:hypothetical protein
MSAFGHWDQADGLPVFRYTGDPRSQEAAEWSPRPGTTSRRHFVGFGNRRLQAFADNEGGLCLWEEAQGQRWLVSPDGGSSGVSLVREEGRAPWGSRLEHWPAGEVPVRTFGPASFEVALHHDGIKLDRWIGCAEGEGAALHVRVRLRNTGTSERVVELVETWQLSPRFATLLLTNEQQRAAAETVRFDLTRHDRIVSAKEIRDPLPPDVPSGHVFGSPYRIDLEAEEACRSEDAGPGTLQLVAEVTLPAGACATRHFTLRWEAGHPPGAAEPAAAEQALRRRLPRATTSLPDDAAAREIPWHAALLTGGACRDEILGGHTLNQGSAYAFSMGFNGAARDPLQHALPLVYAEPDLALSVLRNTCAWGDVHGEIPYALMGDKQPWTTGWQPSDQSLWSLWLAAEYAAATGDLEAFRRDVPFHPQHALPAVPLSEHLRRHFRFLVDGVGRGPHGHLRMRNADWNDLAVDVPGIDRQTMITSGESVLNSAMAAWVLPVWAGLARRLGLDAEWEEALALAGDLRALVAQEWNGKWFRRARCQDAVLGEDDLWLEVQPWAILCGAASTEQARALLGRIDVDLCATSPLGARVRGAVPAGPGQGQVTEGGIWPSINMTLAWAARDHRPDLAWSQWRSMSLAAHATAYPEIWEGTLSGPDSYNAPEATAPGRTWYVPEWNVGMQEFPVNNGHAHSQPLLTYLRLLGVEPTPDNHLQVTGSSGATFTSQTLHLDGLHGSLATLGPVTVQTVAGPLQGETKLQW